jgi:hypothetical protein
MSFSAFNLFLQKLTFQRSKNQLKNLPFSDSNWKRAFLPKASILFCSFLQQKLVLRFPA